MLQKLKASRIVAMKEKDEVAKAILSCLLSDADSIAKKEQRETTDTDVEKSAKSLLKKLEETLKIVGDKATDAQKRELVIVKEYAPQMADAAQTEALVRQYLATLSEDELLKKNQGKIMGSLKTLSGIDMKVASSIVSSLLK